MGLIIRCDGDRGGSGDFDGVELFIGVVGVYIGRGRTTHHSLHEILVLG